MPVAVIAVSLDDIGALALDQASESSQRVIDLVQSDLKPGETLTDRLKLVAKEALKLAQTYQAIEAVLEATRASHSEDKTEAPPDSAGVCRQEGDPSVN